MSKDHPPDDPKHCILVFGCSERQGDESILQRIMHEAWGKLACGSVGREWAWPTHVRQAHRVEVRVVKMKQIRQPRVVWQRAPRPLINGRVKRCRLARPAPPRPTPPCLGERSVLSHATDTATPSSRVPGAQTNYSTEWCRDGYNMATMMLLWYFHTFCNVVLCLHSGKRVLHRMLEKRTIQLCCRKG